VRGLDPTGPAQKAGLKVGDVLVSIAGTPVTSVTSLLSALHKHAPGDTVAVDLYRGAQKMTVRVALAHSP
jgi:S1-C subfamily serine protease